MNFLLSLRQPGSRRGVNAALLLVLVFFVFAGRARTSGGAETVTARDPAAAEVTAEDIQARIKKLEETTGLDEAIKTKVMAVYSQALDQLRLAQDWAAKAAGFEKSQKEAPSLLKTIEADLQKPPVEPVAPDGNVLKTKETGDLGQELSKAESAVKVWQDKLNEIEKEEKHRSARRVEIPKLVADVRKRLDEATKGLAVPTLPGEAPELTNAEQLYAQSRVQAIRQELDSHEKELQSYDARGNLLTARRDQATRNLAQAKKAFDLWTVIVNDRKKQEGDRAARDALAARREAMRTSAPLVVQELARENEEWARQRTGAEGVPVKIESTQKDLEAVSALLAKLRKDYIDIKERIDKAGLTAAVGVLLRRHRADLPSVRYYKNRIKARAAELANAELQLIDAKNNRNAVADVELELQRIQKELGEPVDAEITEWLRDLLRSKKENLEALVRDYDSYLEALADLDGREREMVTEIENLAEYIGENILWIRSTSPFGVSDLPKTGAALRWLSDLDAWFGNPGERHGVFQAIWNDILVNPLLHLLAVLVLTVVLLLRRRLVRGIISSPEPGDSGEPGLRTFQVFLITPLIAAIGPLLVLFIAWRLASSYPIADFTRAVAYGLRMMAITYLMFEVVRQTCRSGGLAEAHLHWPTRTTKVLRRHLRWLLVCLLPLVFVVHTIEAGGVVVHAESLGRVAFVLSAVLIAVFAQRVLRRRGGALSAGDAGLDGARLEQVRRLLLPFAVGVPLAFAVAALLGYDYTAMQLGASLKATLWLLIAIMLPAAVVERWLLGVYHRRVAAQVTETTDAPTDAQNSTEENGPAPAARHEDQIDSKDVTRQLRHFLWGFVAFVLLLAAWRIWADVLPALSILKRVELWSYMTEAVETVKDSRGVESLQRVPQLAEVTLAHILLALLILVMTAFASRNIPGLLEVTILQRLPFDASIRYGITTISRYAIYIVGITYVGQTVGLNWAKLQWLIAAMLVGLGFGLQEIFSNFVSGLIILFERPIRVGDVVTVNDISGTVTRLRIRATTILDWDRKEHVVPNRTFITQHLVNWSLTDRTTRVTLTVGIAYGSDTALARRVLLRIARANALVLSDPAPRAIFMAFGDSSLNFNLYVHVPSRDYYYQAVDELHTAIDNEFRKAGIEIAFPQRDLHLRSVDDPFPVAFRRDDSREPPDRD